MKVVTVHMTIPAVIDPAAASLAAMDAQKAIAARLTQSLGVSIDIGSGSADIDKQGATQAKMVLHIFAPDEG